MKKIVLILLLIVVSSQVFAQIGDNKDFRITSQSDFHKRISKGRDVTLRRYIVVPDFDKKFRDIFETTDEHAVLAKFSFMLRRNKRAWIEKYIENPDTKPQANDLVKGLYYFSKKQYANALIHFEQVNSNEYDFLKYLLIADCKYELNTDLKYAKTGIELYQTAMDKCNNELEKILINNRVKHIRYR